MVKIFIGNFPDVMLVTNDNVRPLFEAHGIVTYILELPLFIREAFKNKNDETYGIFHMWVDPPPTYGKFFRDFFYCLKMISDSF